MIGKQISATILFGKIRKIQQKQNKKKQKKTKQTELSHFKKLSLNLGLLDACLLEEILTKEGQLSYINCEFRN